MIIESNKNIIKEKINIENERLNRAKEQGFDINTIWYHVSNKDFDKFNIDKSQDGCIWLTRDLDSIKNGNTGASINSDKIFIHEFFIKANKIGGWKEEEDLMIDQMIQQGFDGILLDNDIKMFNSNNIRKTADLFKNKITEYDINKSFNNKVTFYHGNENKIHRFSDYKPSFFTSDKEYAKCYGDNVKEYNIELKKPFDTATDEIARDYYNTIFLNDDLGKEAIFIKKGGHITANTADDFWAFISVEAKLGKALDYDSIIVDEKTGNNFTTNLSIVPFDKSQIKPLMLKNKNKNKNKNKHSF